MASCTDMQRRAGIADSPRRHEEELVELGQPLGLGDNPALRRLLVENVPDTVNFLASIGVDFIGPLLQPPFRDQALLPGAAGRARLCPPPDAPLPAPRRRVPPRHRGASAW